MQAKGLIKRRGSLGECDPIPNLVWEGKDW